MLLLIVLLLTFVVARHDIDHSGVYSDDEYLHHLSEEAIRKQLNEQFITSKNQMTDSERIEYEFAITDYDFNDRVDGNEIMFYLETQQAIEISQGPAGVKKMPRDMLLAKVRALLRKFDKDGDGMLSFGEFSNAISGK